MGVARRTRDLRRRLRSKRDGRKLKPKPVIPPSPSGLWWFLERLTPQERTMVNEANSGDDVVNTIRYLYARYPELAAEALRH